VPSNLHLKVEGKQAGIRGREARRHFGLSLADVAREIGVDRSTVGTWERGTRRPVGEAAVRYARLIRKLERICDAESARDRESVTESL
jgi:DNA-binding transcriptional regulator YiaG